MRKSKELMGVELLQAYGSKLDHPDNMRELIEMLLKVRSRSGELVPLRANRVQQEFEASAGKRNIVLKARQMGLTTWIAARFFLQTITRPGTLTVQVAHDMRSSEEIFRIVHRFLENLPEDLHEWTDGALITSRSNVRELVFPKIDSGYRVETAADPNAGRGLTIRNLHCSEVALWPREAGATLAALRAAVPADGEIVLESTPQGAAGAFYEEWQRAEETGTVRHFFPWWWEESYCARWDEGWKLTDPERELMEAHGVSLEQIAYRRQLKAGFRRLAAQEFAEDAESCFLVSGDCLFDVGLVQERLREVAGSQWSEVRGASHEEACRDGQDARSFAGAQDDTRERGVLWFYPVVRGKSYVIGVDPAGGGVEGDYACAQVLERQTGLQCAELRGHFSPREMAQRSAELAREYNGAELVVERNNHGHEVLAYLNYEIGYENLFCERGQAGWLTGVANRGPMLAEMEAWFSMYPERVNSRRLLEEMKTFVRKENGRAEAAQGAHDDTVMAFAIALAARGR